MYLQVTSSKQVETSCPERQKQAYLLTLVPSLYGNRFN